MKSKVIAITVTLAALLLCACGGDGSSTSVPGAAPKAAVASKPEGRHPEEKAESASPAQPSKPAPPKRPAEPKPRPHPPKAKRASGPTATTPRTKAAAKPPPALERLVESGSSDGRRSGVGPGGAVLTPQRAEKVLQRIKEEAHEDAERPGDTEDAVEKALGELAEGSG